MDEDFYLTLIYKELDGSASEQEAAELAAWLEASEENRAFAERVREAWAVSGKLAAEPEVNLDEAFGMLEERLKNDPEADFPTETETIPLSPPHRKNRSWMGIAAGIAALIVAGWFAFPYLFGTPDPEWTTVYSEGEVLELTLPDGSITTLNKNSSLSYIAEAGAEDRTVKLEGEAFFEVKPAGSTFMVQTEAAEVTVLGTSFNVRSYPESPEVRVQVSTGKVRFMPTEGDEDLILLPGDRGIFNRKTKSLDKEKAKGREDYTWSFSGPIFEDTPLNEALMEIRVLYSVEIELEEFTAEDCPLSANFGTMEVDDMLETIAVVFGGEMEKVEEGKYVLKGLACD